MDRNLRLVPAPQVTVPRTRGDGPARELSELLLTCCSPHTRGWTDSLYRRMQKLVLFPAHAGMDRERGGVHLWRGPVPRTRGDGPTIPSRFTSSVTCSPHTRGWTVKVHRPICHGCLFPAHAGMDRETWGKGRQGRSLFPAHAGMDRCCRGHEHRQIPVPRTRGDGPPSREVGEAAGDCSPHTRGWTGQPTASRRSADSVPRTRGDGPNEITRLGLGMELFPAHAGMDR